MRRDGTFEVGASKTVADEVTELGRNRSARFDWEDGTTAVRVDFSKKAASKSTVSVVHQRLMDETEAAATKTMWRAKLTELKSLLEFRS